MAIVAVGTLIAFLTVVLVAGPTVVATWLGLLLYNIAKGLFYICDFLQLCYRRLAGLETYWIKDSASGSYNEASGDILLSLFTNNSVIEAIIAMTIFAVALLIIVTIVQIIRVEYTTEGSKNSKGTILGKAIKSFAMFILVPVVCFIGVFVSNKLLLALDAATSQAGSTTLSGSVFLAAAADANVVRNGNIEGNLNAEKVGKSLWKTTNDETAKATLYADGSSVVMFKTVFYSNKSTLEGRQQDIATKIDNVFVRRYVALDKENNNVITVGDAISSDSYVSALINLDEDTKLHYMSAYAVQYFYDLFKINYFILYAATAFVLMSLVKASVGLITRLYKALALFIISPGVTALTPLDDGNAYKSWRKAFISSVLGAYGYVVALNLLFLLMGVVKNVHIFPDSLGYYSANCMVQCLMTLVGVNMLTDFSKTFSGFIGGEDTLASGTSMSGNVMKNVKTLGKFAGGAATIGAGAFGGIAAKVDNWQAGRKGGVLEKKGDSLRAQLINDPNNKSLNKKLAKNEKKLANWNENGQSRMLSRAARGSKLALRGQEVFGDVVTGSPVASLLNTMTGGYVEAFGGKSIKNLDEKIEPKHSQIYKKAEEYEGGNLPQSVMSWINPVKIAKNIPKLGGKLYSKLHGPGGAKVEEAGANVTNFLDGLNVGSTAKKLEGTKKDPGKITSLEAKRKAYEGVKDSESYYNGVVENYDNFTSQLGALISSDTSTSIGKKEFISKATDMETMLNSGIVGLDGTTLDSLRQLFEGASGNKFDSNFNYDMFKDTLKNAKAGIENGEGHAKIKEVKGALADFQAIGDDKKSMKSIDAIDNIANTLTGFDDYVNKNKRPVVTPDVGGGKGGQGGSYAMDANKVEIKGNTEVKGTTKIEKGEIKDTSSLANTFSKAMKDASKKVEQKEKDEKIANLLTATNKLLGDIKKNTKK